MNREAGQKTTPRTGARPPAASVGRAMGYALLAVLFSPLVFARGFLFPFVVPKAFYLQTLVALALTLLAVAWVRGETDARILRQRRPGRDPFLWAFLAFVLVATVAGGLGASPARSLLGTLERRWGVLTWGSFLGFYLLLRIHLDDGGWRRALQVTVAVATGVGLYGLLRAVGLWPGQPEPVGWSRMSATLGNAGYLAAYEALALALTGYLTMRTEARWLRLVYAAAAMVQLGAVLLSGTRAVVLGAGGAFFVLAVIGFFSATGRRLRWAAAGGVTLLVAAGSVAFLLAPDGGPHVTSWWERLVSVLSPETSSARLRLVVWSATLDGIREAPLLGAGPENFELVWSRHFDPVIYHVAGTTIFDRAHNVLVGAAATVGLLGLSAYLAMWGAVGWGIHRAWRRGGVSGGEASVLAFGAITYLVHLLFWFEDHTSFLAFVLLAGLVGHLASGGEAPGRRPDGSGGRGGVPADPGTTAADRAGSGEAAVTDLHRTGEGLSRTVRFGVPVVLLALGGTLAWHNLRVLDAARLAWDGEYSMDAWEGAEHYRAALARDLPGSEPILRAYLRRITFLAGHGDGGAPEGPTPRMERALASADRALAGWAARDPHDPHVYVHRSRFCAIRRDVMGGSGGGECAVRNLRRAIELSPGRVRFRHWLANHHLSAGKPGLALQVLRKALRVHDSFGETYHYMARVHHRTGDMDEAVRQARVAVDLGYGGQPATFMLELAGWLEEEGRVGEAADLLESHLSLRYGKLPRPELATPPGRGFPPWDLPLVSRLPLLHWEAGRPAEAIRTARFLAHRLGVAGDEDDDGRGARIRGFIEDVRADRRERWSGAPGVLDELSGQEATAAPASTKRAGDHEDASTRPG